MADNIRLFRTTALINNTAIYLSKASASRLSPFTHKVRIPLQTTFIKGRFILDGVLTLYESLHDIHSSRREVVILKIDFKKAYDYVRWAFLRDILLARGFVPAYVHRLIQLVCGG